MFTGFMKTIPIEVEEAAMIDGCSPLRTYFTVVLPDAWADAGIGGNSGDDVDMERLSPAAAGAGSDEV